MTSRISADELLSEKSINVLYTIRQPIDWLHSLTEESETGIFVTFIVITACDTRERLGLYIVSKSVLTKRMGNLASLYGVTVELETAFVIAY
jgi:hypothetical protein